MIQFIQDGKLKEENLFAVNQQTQDSGCSLKNSRVSSTGLMLQAKIYPTTRVLLT